MISPPMLVHLLVPVDVPPGNNLFFYSVPTSPRTRTISNIPYGCYTPEYSTPMTPYHDANSDFEDFEFETSRSFSVDAGYNVTSQKVKDSLVRKQHQQRQPGDSLPTTMAFADELFSDGKVIPFAPPLKLPPCLGQKRHGNQSPMPSSPRSPSFALKLPFSYQRLWNDDYDPFMVALEHVREEEKRGKGKSNDHNMVGVHDQQNKQIGPPTPLHSPNANSTATGLLQPKKQVGQSPKRLALPKGLEFARQVRLIQMGHTERCNEPSEETAKKKITQESGGPPTCRKETKGMKIKRLLWIPSFGKVDDENKKPKDHHQSSAISRKPTFLRRLSFQSGGSATHRNVGEERVLVRKQLTKMTLAHYRPRLLLCMGYKARYAK